MSGAPLLCTKEDRDTDKKLTICIKQVSSVSATHKSHHDDPVAYTSPKPTASPFFLYDTLSRPPAAPSLLPVLQPQAERQTLTAAAQQGLGNAGSRCRRILFWQQHEMGSPPSPVVAFPRPPRQQRRCQIQSPIGKKEEKKKKRHSL